MPCDPEILRHVPLFALLDDEELAVLAALVELRKFAPRQRIYKMGEEGGRAYVLVSGAVEVSTVDEDSQNVVVDAPAHGEFFGFASMLEGRRTRPRPQRKKSPPQWRWIATTSLCCCNESRWREWIC